MSQAKEDEGQVGGDGDDVVVAEVGDEDIGGHEGEGGEKPKFQTPNFKFQIPKLETDEKIHARSGEAEVEGDEAFEGLIGKIGEQAEEQEVGRVEEAGLVVGGEGGARIEGGVPEERGYW